MTKQSSRLTVLTFCLLIFGFAIATLLHPPAEFSQTENRVLAQRPEWNLADVLNGSFESAYEDYLTDQFILRDEWIAFKTAVERLALKRESKDVYFAEEGYLIEKHTGVFQTELARENAETLAEFVWRYRTQFGSEHLSVMIVPNAVSILRDRLPPFAPSSDEEAYLEQLAEGLPEDVWFDAGDVLRAHDDEPLYYRTDHHWETLAAFYAAQAWMEKKDIAALELSDYEVLTVSSDFEGTIQSKLGIHTVGDTIELFESKEPVACTVSSDGVEKDSLYDMAALDTKDQYAFYLGGNHGLVRIQTAANDGRKLLIIKDSYANCLIPFLTGAFEVIDVLDLRYSRQRVSELIAAGGYTDLLILYNAAGFAADTSLAKLSR